MNEEINKIKRKILIKYPPLGNIIANLKFRECNDISTAGTDGETVYYNKKFLNSLTVKQQIFLIAHEVCHVAFNHIYRSEGKNEQIWNIATDAVINALLVNDGLQIIEGAVNIPEAYYHDAEEMYEMLMEAKRQQQQKKQNREKGQNNKKNQGEPESQSTQESQSEQGNQENQNGQSNQENQNGESNQENQGGQTNQQNNKDDNSTSQNMQDNQQSDAGHDTHSLWEKAIAKKKEQDGSSKDENKSKVNEERDKHENKSKDKNGKEKNNEDDKNNENNENNQKNEKDKCNEENQKEELKKEASKFQELGERETFKKCKEERRKQAQEFSKELSKESSKNAGTGIQSQEKNVSNIGTALPIINWRRLLRQALKYNEEYTRKNARMRDGFFKYKVEQIPIFETEIVLDTSGSVSENLLKNFLRECKNIIDTSRVKVGCFNTKFHGFKELRRAEDIDKMSFPIGGGTDFNSAVEAFSNNSTNKIIFTDGEASMPRKMVRNVIWVVYGDEEINPKGGQVINITGEELRRLRQRFIKEDDELSL